MTKPVTLTVKDVIGHKLCISVKDGEKVFAKVKAILNDGGRVRLSFKGVGLITGAFLNGAIGRLFGIFDKKKIHESVRVRDIEEGYLLLIKAIADNAIRYYKDPARQKAILKEEGFI